MSEFTPQPQPQSQSSQPESETVVLPSGTVFVGLVHHEHGTESYVAATKDRVLDAVYDYVCEWWMDTNLETEAPEDPQTAIETYFEHVGDESYTISEALVLV